mgnify:FL=1
MTLGMSKRNISTILMLETSFMACIALVTGLLLGIFGSQMMSVFTAKIFEAGSFCISICICTRCRSQKCDLFWCYIFGGYALKYNRNWKIQAD